MGIVIVGAGVTGLTIARQLARARIPVTVLEREREAGGLARTFRYGEHAFDIGPHRFHTEDARVASLVRETLGTELLEIRRASAVRAFGALHPWPLRPRVALALPPLLLARCALDLVRREQPPGESFEADVVRRYGRTLYETFFAPYTRRFLERDPGTVHRDWARAGMDRAVIDRRLRSSSLGDLLRGALLPAAAETRFLYPRAGIGRFAQALAADVATAGGTILVERTVTGMEIDGDRVVAAIAAGERFPCEGVVWTGPIGRALDLLGEGGRALEFRSTVLFNVEVRGAARLPYQWIYFGGDESFVRISQPTAFSGATAPPGRSGICVEVTCREGDDLWNDPSRRIPAVTEDLVRAGAVASAAHVAAIHVERVADTYPVYTLGYREELRDALGALSRFKNFLVAGRSGRFWYNNMDHSIAQGLAVARQIETGGALSGVDVGEREFWAARTSDVPGSG